MPAKAVRYKGRYAVGEGTVRLSVIVGDRQYGSSIVFLDDELIANGDIEDVPIGKGPDLDGRTLAVHSVVSDVRDRKGELSVTWRLTGGPDELRAEKEGEAQKAYGTRVFVAEIRLVGS